jgi:hypothetical protein
MSEEVLQAEIIDEELTAPSSELHIIKAVPGSDIVSNIAGLKTWVELQMMAYDVPNIKTEDDYQQAKRDRTSLRSMSAAIENERKRIKGIYEAPLKAFEASVKDVTAPIGNLDGRMKEAIDTYDEQVKDAKRAIIKQHYEDLAPAIALPLEGQTAALVPYERIEDSKWLNRSITDKAACDELDKIVDGIADDELTLAGLHLAHAAEAKAEYFATLDLKAAIARDKQLTDQEQRSAALEAERARLAAEQEAARAASATAQAQQVPSPAPVPQATPKSAEDVVRHAGGIVAPQPVATGRRTVFLRIDDVTELQFSQLIGWMKAHGIHGTVMKGEAQR